MMNPSDIDFDDLDGEADEGDGQPKGYVLKGFDSAIEAEGARYALRILRNARVYRRVFEHRSFAVDDTLALLGVRERPKRGKPGRALSLRAALKCQAKLLESKKPARRVCLVRNLNRLADILRLNDDQRRVLHLALVTTKTSGFNELWSAASLSPEQICEAIGRAVDLPARTVAKALRPVGVLCRSGLFETRRIFSSEQNPLELNARVCEALISPRFGIEQFLRCLVRRGAKPRLTLDDYAHIRDADVVRRYLADATARRRKGVNILLYGLPGTGKTEFVRALAGALKLELYEVPNEDEDGDPIRGNKRFSSYAICQKILAGRQRQLLLFDEVEDVFGNSAAALFAMFEGMADGVDSRLGKSWTNEILETNSVPAVWVCNDMGAMDNAYVRRFDMVVEFRAPGPATSRRMIARYFRPGEISNACIERLSAIEQLPPAQIERAAKVVRSLRSSSVDRRDREVQGLVDASLRAMDLKVAVPAISLPAHYDPAFINADRELGPLIEGLRQRAGARMCLYGPPGTGKTAFAHHLGQELGLPVQVKRGSDLLGCYVGETEKNIATAFSSARDGRAILVIDEADSFLRDRVGASRSWEVTQVNELLTQLEAFEGIFIASTNLVDTLDAASLRRFDFKVKFDYLTRAQRCAMLACVATEPSAMPEEDQRARQAIERLEWLTPGDFANALRQLRVTGELATPARLVALIEAEAAMKPEGRRRSIGFIN